MAALAAAALMVALAGAAALITALAMALVMVIMGEFPVCIRVKKCI